MPVNNNAGAIAVNNLPVVIADPLDANENRLISLEEQKIENSALANIENHAIQTQNPILDLSQVTSSIADIVSSPLGLINENPGWELNLQGLARRVVDVSVLLVPVLTYYMLGSDTPLAVALLGLPFRAKISAILNGFRALAADDPAAFLKFGYRAAFDAIKSATNLWLAELVCHAIAPAKVRERLGNLQAKIDEIIDSVLGAALEAQSNENLEQIREKTIDKMVEAVQDLLIENNSTDEGEEENLLIEDGNNDAEMNRPGPVGREQEEGLGVEISGEDSDEFILNDFDDESISVEEKTDVNDSQVKSSRSNKRKERDIDNVEGPTLKKAKQAERRSARISVTPQKRRANKSRIRGVKKTKNS